jgi:phosphohistidine swiveling domain-containing protein
MQDKIDPSFDKAPLLTGIAAGGGVVSGVVVFNADDAVKCKEPCILVREETDPDDIQGMFAAVGILTSTGGLTSHAAVVARGEGKVCVVGATSMEVQDDCAMVSHAVIINPGDMITIDGATGRVWSGKVPMIPGSIPDGAKSLCWGDLQGAVYVERPAVLDVAGMRASIAQALAVSPTICLDLSLMNLTTGTAIAATQAIMQPEVWTGHDQEFNLVLDARQPLTAGAQQFLKMFGLDAEGSAQHLVSIAVDAVMQFPAELQARTTILGKVDEGDLSTLQASGVSVSCHVKTFADLIDATGPVSVSKQVIEKVFGGDKAYQKALSLMFGDKPPPQEPTVAHWYGPAAQGEL